MSSVLIVGAGIAGDALAVMLDRAGWQVTVVELASGLRSGGQTVDLRGDSREVLEGMGLLDACLTHLVDQRGLKWIREDGRSRAEMPVTAFGGNGFVSTEELLRTDLARVIHAAAGPRTVHRWGDTVTAIRQYSDSVFVAFRHHDPERFDLVVGADGAHSRVRSLVFGPEENYRRPLGLAHAWFTLRADAGTPDLDGWSVICNLPGSRLLAARPGHDGEQEVGLTFPADELPARGDREARFGLLEREFAGAGWRAGEFLRAAREADDFALDTYDQIVMPTWHDGRVVLLGDSAWCASPLSGLGTALALQGAQALAESLAGGESSAGPKGRAANEGDRGIHEVPLDTVSLGTSAPETSAPETSALQTSALDAVSLETALNEFERRMRPRADAARRMFPGRVRSYAPRTAWGIRVMTGVMRLVQTRPIAALLERGAASYGTAPTTAEREPLGS